MQTTLIAKVLSDSDDETFYSISLVKKQYFCTCPHNQYRKKTCKHILKVKEALVGQKIAGVFLINDFEV